MSIGRAARGVVAGALLVLAAGACVRVEKVYECDGGTIVVMPETRHAQLLVVVDLERASANLTGTYQDIAQGLVTELAQQSIVVDELAVLPLWGSVTSAPALVWGESGQGSGGDATQTLAADATSGSYDQPIAGVTAEQYNLATIAAQLDAATLPPEQTNGSSAPFFSPPKDLFLVLTIAPNKRLCADTDAACALGGKAPIDYFSATAGDGTAAWLKLPSGSYSPGHIYQVFVTTSEGEAADAFRTRCAAVPNFPKALLDVIQPSPSKYYTDLAPGLVAKGWHAEQLDLCDALGSGGAMMAHDLAGRIAAATR